ncbi:Predicted exporter of the RND superfamily [hydrothermal vent metagenome]|uniref:Predicted exporter of the RND superfamily n=1 Tax=hydrothermal vent metagenome TaxID=652676 RepID=A0A3B1A2U6_9ZZZZ
MFDRYATLVINKPYITLVFMIALVVGLASATPSLIFTNDFKVFFSDDNPQLLAFDHLEQTYNKQENLLFYVAPKNKNVFTKENLTAIHELSNLGWRFPYVQRVDSITNFQHSIVNGDDLTTGYLVDDPKLLTAKKIQQIKTVALNDIRLVKNLIAIDGSVTAVNVHVNPDKEDLSSNTVIVKHAEKIVSDFKIRYPNIEISLTGTTFANYSLGLGVEQDIRELVIFSYIVILLGLLVLLRSFTGMLITLLIVSFSIIGTFGMYAWLGKTLTVVSGFVPSIIITIGVADAVHILVSFFYERGQGKNKINAIYEALRINALPVFLTSLTTIIGVLMLNFSDSPPYRDLGNMVAIGVVLAYIFSMLLLPAMLVILPAGQFFNKLESSIHITSFANFVIKQRRLLLVGMGLIVIISTGFIANNKLTERWHEYFDFTFEERRTIEAINTNLSGVHAIRYSLETNIKDGINDPNYLMAVDKFAKWYREQQGVAYVRSIADTIKRLNKNMHEDNPKYYRIPEQRELVAQYLLLYELSLPRGLGMEDQINFDRSATQFVALLEKTDSESILNIERRSRQWLAKNAPNLKVSEGSGLDMVFAHINHRNIYSLLKGTALGLFLISLVLMLVLRSIRMGLISMIPNLAPAALAYGTWGMLVGEIDLSASVVMCMTLGIVVDDTVHFLTKYIRARRELALDAIQGIRYAFNTVGVALIITTLVLVSGFLVLTSSHMLPTARVGTLLSITLSYALLIDFLLLPPLLIYFDRYANPSVKRVK